MSRFREKLTKKLVRAFVRSLGVEHVVADYRKRLDRVGAVDRQNQMLLRLAYQSHNGSSPAWQDIEFRSFSQNGEDGLLLYVFSQIGMASRRSVEIGCGSGVECNTANLIVNHGFRDLLLDAREGRLALGRRFFRKCRDTCLHQPRLVHTWVTRENIDKMIRDHGYTGSIDLLSIDLDGMDYWIWEAIDCIEPRVVVVEYNATFGATQSIAVRYRPGFRRTTEPFGASLAALVKLGRRNGYRLVGCDQHRINAFFVHRGIGDDVVPEVDLAPHTSARPAPIPDGWVQV